jgi:hypothetical protein
MVIRENAKMIDVCIITKNTKSALFQKCMAAINKYVPYNKLIIEKEGTRGQARQKCIQAVTREIFAFIDDDVIIDANWYPQMTYWMQTLNAGAVTGVPQLYTKTSARKYLELLNREINIDKLPKPVDCLHTGSCLVRTELVKDIKIPAWLQHREDLYITEYIRAKGYECYRVPVKFRHYAGGSWDSLYAENIANLRLLGKLDMHTFLKKTVGSWVVTARLLIKQKELRVLFWNFPRMISIIRGYNWRRYAYVKS